MTTLYKHQIFCLHGLSGTTTAPISSADTVISVDADVIQDVTIQVGSQIYVNDGVNQSPSLTILSIDSGLGLLTLDNAVGYNYLAGVNVYRDPHIVQAWTESIDPLVYCPEDATHPIQPGSNLIVEIRTPNETTIIQSPSGHKMPALAGKRVDVAAGGTGTVDFSWPYVVTMRGIVGYFESSNTGDTFDVLSAVDTPVGTLTSGVLAGATVLPIDGTIASLVRPSQLCKLFEIPNIDDLGEIIAVDKIGLTITVSTPTTQPFSVAAAILITNAHAIGVPVPQSTVAIGGDEIEGNDVPANKIIRVIYHNAGPNPSGAVAMVKILT